jgi:hypothetical protein
MPAGDMHEVATALRAMHVIVVEIDSKMEEGFVKFLEGQFESGRR